MQSRMRCSASNHVCCEANSGRASFTGGDQASLSSLGNPKTEVARAVSSAPGWRLSDAGIVSAILSESDLGVLLLFPLRQGGALRP